MTHKVGKLQELKTWRDINFPAKCCKRKHTLSCKQMDINSTQFKNSGKKYQGLFLQRFKRQFYGYKSFIFTKDNFTINGYKFTYKRNVSPFAYVYVTENGEEALIYYNAARGTLRGSFELNDGRSFAFHPCFVFCLTRTARNIHKLYTYMSYSCFPEYVFYEYDQNHLREALKKVVKFV